MAREKKLTVEELVNPTKTQIIEGAIMWNKGSKRLVFKRGDMDQIMALILLLILKSDDPNTETVHATFAVDKDVLIFIANEVAMVITILMFLRDYGFVPSKDDLDDYVKTKPDDRLSEFIQNLSIKTLDSMNDSGYLKGEFRKMIKDGQHTIIGRTKGSDKITVIGDFSNEDS